MPLAVAPPPCAHRRFLATLGPRCPFASFRFGSRRYHITYFSDTHALILYIMQNSMFLSPSGGTFTAQVVSWSCYHGRFPITGRGPLITEGSPFFSTFLKPAVWTPQHHFAGRLDRELPKWRWIESSARTIVIVCSCRAVSNVSCRTLPVDMTDASLKSIQRFPSLQSRM